MKLGAGNLSEPALGVGPLRLHDLLGPVERQGAGPGGKPVICGVLVQIRVKPAAWAVQDGLELRLSDITLERTVELELAVNDHSVLELVGDADHGFEVGPARHGHDPAEIGLRRREEPHPHLGDDAIVRLGEQAVEQRPDAELVLLPRLRPWQRPHAGA